MKHNNTPAHLKNLKATTPHDSLYTSRRIQFDKTATSTATTTTTINTNDSLLGSNRLETLELCISQEGKEETEDQHQHLHHHPHRLHHHHHQVSSSSYKNSRCNKIRNNNVKKSIFMHTHNTGVTTNRYSTSKWWWWWLDNIKSSTAAAFCVTFLILTTTCSLCSASLCESQSWWDPYKDKCIPCTVCQGDMIPLRPCQMHRDTVCGSIYDLKIDWVVLSKTEPNWKERRKFDGLDYGLDHHQLTAEQLQQLQDETEPVDWQTAALFLAVMACLLFFIVAACILVHHMRQWKRMERRLDQDVEELSTKLMAKLAEVQSLEGGTFFIGNADALRIPTTVSAAFHQPQHVMLSEKSDKHQQNLHHDRRLFSNTMTTLKSGNVYIEENSSKC